MNWWQMGYSLQPYGECSAMVEACVSAYSQTVAMCPGNHWRSLDNGGRERVKTSALSRILKEPNDYCNISDFLLNLTRRLYERGESFALAIRNNRAEITELHLMREGYPMLGVDGSIFYHLSGNEIIEQRFNMGMPIPARDVLHVRLHTPRHPLKGVSPILSTLLDRALAGAMLNNQVEFFLNKAKPSFILETEQVLTLEQIRTLRESWKMQTQENVGGTPILTAGLKAHTISQTAQDAQLAELLKMSDQSIALAFRMPLQILGMGGGVTFASTELLMQSWIASGLGFALNHIEEAFGQLFELKGLPDEYLELDTRALLRSAFRERIEGLARGVMGGIFSSDEARSDFDLPSTPGGFGEMPRVQQQVVPLDWHAMNPPPPPAPKPEPSDDSEGPDDNSEPVEEKFRRSFDEHYPNFRTH